VVSSGGDRRYLAFMRGLNVGGHRVSMADLRDHIASLGHSNVETFIASGNVIFDATGRKAAAALEQEIEARLQDRLGFAVATFLRTPAELTAAASALPFTAADLATPGYTVHVGFLRDAPDAALRALLKSSETSYDAFGTGARELYWLCRGRLSDSPVKFGVIEKSVGLGVTLRNITTVRKLVARFGE